MNTECHFPCHVHVLLVIEHRLKLLKGYLVYLHYLVYLFVAGGIRCIRCCCKHWRRFTRCDNQ